MKSIILPVRDEPKLGEILTQIHAVMSGDQYEVLIIMGDKEKLFSSIPPHPHQSVFVSYGDSLERSILLGFSVARGDKLLVLDADGSHPVSQIPEMFRTLDKCDMVIGSRYLPNSEFHYPLFRRFVAWCFRTYANFCGSSLSDPMSGFFAIKHTVLNDIKFKPFAWKTGLEISVKMHSTIIEMPVRIVKRNAGHSKANWRLGLKIMWDILWR